MVGSNMNLEVNSNYQNLRDKFYMNQKIIKDKLLRKFIPDTFFSVKEVPEEVRKYTLIKKKRFSSRGEGITVWAGEELHEDEYLQVLLQKALQFRAIVANQQIVAIYVLTPPKEEKKFIWNLFNGMQYVELSPPYPVHLISFCEKVLWDILTKLDCDFCGADIIEEMNTKRLFFLEANSAPFIRKEVFPRLIMKLMNNKGDTK